MDSLVKLPKEGFALIITDLHGNWDDFIRYLHIWEDFESKENHLIITGDFIHSMGQQDDKSIEIVDYLSKLFYDNDNVYLLLGNHEWSIISDVIIYKAGKNLNIYFQEMLKKKFGEMWQYKLKEYTEFFRKLPIAVKTENKVFISHSGPPTGHYTLNDIVNLKRKGYMNNVILYNLLWNRYGDYSNDDLKTFLSIVDCNAMVVGHTPVKGVKLIDNVQIVVSSSFSKGKKAYIELDLEKDIKNAKDIFKMVKYLK